LAESERKVFVFGGTISGVGGNVGQTTVDDKWRITLPPDVREGIKRGQVLLVGRSGDALVVKPSVDIEKFERELKGCISGSKISPERLKEIWGIRHDHD
jgi:bifunctional DNA-binding transcriptional regulator/antitoxin component of YhaV-PrlF toxin-antitoxin module